VPDRDNRVRDGQRITGQRQQPQVGIRTQPLAGQREHVGRGVGGHHPQTRGQQVPGQRPAAAAELENQAIADSGQQLQDAGGAAVGVQAVAPVVDERQVALVVVHSRLTPRR